MSHSHESTPKRAYLPDGGITDVLDSFGSTPPHAGYVATMTAVGIAAGERYRSGGRRRRASGIRQR